MSQNQPDKPPWNKPLFIRTNEENRTADLHTIRIAVCVLLVFQILVFVGTVVFAWLVVSRLSALLPQGPTFP